MGPRGATPDFLLVFVRLNDAELVLILVIPFVAALMARGRGCPDLASGGRTCSLLRHLEEISDKIVVTHQLEMEFKKNRQQAIFEGMQELRPPTQISRLGLFSDAKEVAKLQRDHKASEARIKKLKSRLRKALEAPTVHDPVFKACQRIFHRNDDLVLGLTDKRRHQVRRKATRRFLLGCPPRKKSDTSVGDAFNWEWMVACAERTKSELVIVSRDSDYGMSFEGRSFLNDHLRQEFSERVSKKRKVYLFDKLSEALKLFELKVTPQEEAEERAIVDDAKLKKAASPPGGDSIKGEVRGALDDVVLEGRAGIKDREPLN